MCMITPKSDVPMQIEVRNVNHLQFLRCCQTLIYTQLLTPPACIGLITPFVELTVICLTLSALLFPKLEHGVTGFPQEQHMPCQAYPPTFEEHFGHSSFPSNSPWSMVDCVQSCGSNFEEEMSA
jgi:hypothetical protein